MQIGSWSSDMPYASQLAIISSLCDNTTLLEGLVNSGHSYVHFAGEDTPISDMDKCYDKVYNANYDLKKIMPSDDIIRQEIHRVATEMVPASHFSDKEMMVGALSETLSGAAHIITKWLNGDIFGRTQYGLKLSVAFDSFVGTGIATDGNERATTVATLILTRHKCHIDNVEIPFSITTMYPDISEELSVGTVVSTGNNFGQQIVQYIETSDIATQMYWRLKELGENVAMYDNPRSDKPRSAVLYATCNGIDYTVSYNNNSLTRGFMQVYNPAQHRYVALDILDEETIKELRKDEARRIGLSLHRTHTGSQLPITTAHHLFPIKGGGTLCDNSQSLKFEYFDPAQDDFDPGR